MVIKSTKKSAREKPQPVDDDSHLPRKLAQPARRALVGAGIQRLEQLSQVSEGEIKSLHGIGPNAIAQLRKALHAEGLSFADEKR